MIAVYAVAVVKPEHIDTFKTLVNSLVEASRQDKGCVSYQLGTVAGKENTFAFVEQWQSMADLETHTQQVHFTQAVENLRIYLANHLILT
ncbi:antibiotic biosynthesis monooxygenase [Actinobacillus equuli]|nr:antibiotic biosynthesis monooxygenase [Actinobacillus equuli]